MVQPFNINTRIVMAATEASKQIHTFIFEESSNLEKKSSDVALSRLITMPTVLTFMAIARRHIKTLKEIPSNSRCYIKALIISDRLNKQLHRLTDLSNLVHIRIEKIIYNKRFLFPELRSRSKNLGSYCYYPLDPSLSLPSLSSVQEELLCQSMQEKGLLPESDPAFEEILRQLQSFAIPQ
jgi:hypothetical protein